MDIHMICLLCKEFSYVVPVWALAGAGVKLMADIYMCVNFMCVYIYIHISVNTHTCACTPPRLFSTVLCSLLRALRLKLPGASTWEASGLGLLCLHYGLLGRIWLSGFKALSKLIGP